MDIRLLSPHRFIPRILKRAIIRRKETRGYPKVLKKRVAKTIDPKKRANGLGDPAMGTPRSFISNFFIPWK